MTLTQREGQRGRGSGHKFPACDTATLLAAHIVTLALQQEGQSIGTSVHSSTSEGTIDRQGSMNGTGLPPPNIMETSDGTAADAMPQPAEVPIQETAPPMEPQGEATPLHLVMLSMA